MKAVHRYFRIRRFAFGRFVFCAVVLLLVGSLAGCGTMWESLKNREPEKKTDQFERSNALIAEGNFEAAYKENEKIFAERRGAADVALFNMGMVSASSSNPRRNYPRALASFKTLLKDYPQSPLADQAKVWIQVLEAHQRVVEEKQAVMEEKGKLLDEKRALIREKETLSQERERLKYTVEKSRQVDVDIEKRRRKTLIK
jgi:hypothetical protein